MISVEEIEKASMLNMEKKAKEKKTTKEQRKQKEAENETFFLEKSLFKIGKLLGLCYGQAGAKMIGINISTADSGGDFNPKLQGELIFGVYSFCKIANYKILCTLLEEKMMTYVNELAEIIHTQVDIHQGVPNRNFGDDFIIIWKVPESVD